MYTNEVVDHQLREVEGTPCLCTQDVGSEAAHSVLQLADFVLHDEVPVVLSITAFYVAHQCHPELLVLVAPGLHLSLALKHLRNELHSAGYSSFSSGGQEKSRKLFALRPEVSRVSTLRKFDYGDIKRHQCHDLVSHVIKETSGRALQTVFTRRSIFDLPDSILSMHSLDLDISR